MWKHSGYGSRPAISADAEEEEKEKNSEKRATTARPVETSSSL